MTTFQDGPAKGVTLMLRRAPLFLRVVKSGDQWDALDILDDFAKVEESIIAYRRVGEAYTVHINARKASGFYAGAIYGVVDDQPDDATMRDLDRWREWCILKQGRAAA